jgi:spore coat protein H
MNFEHWKASAALVALLGAGCAADVPHDDEATDDPQEAAALIDGERARPEGWSDASHGEGTTPDYARLFPDDRVQRIELELTSEIEARLYDDLTQRLGAPSTSSSGVGGFGGFGGTSPAALAACSAKARDEPCTFLGLKGTCGPNTPFVPNFGDGNNPIGFPRPAAVDPAGTSGSSARPVALACREADLGGALDMVPGDPIAVPVTVRYDGRSWGHVAMRFKGNSSLMGPWRASVRKLGMRLDFDKFEGDQPAIKNQRIFGFSKLIFNPAFQDATLIREKLAADLLRESGLPAARAAFYEVHVKVGEKSTYWGLYTVLEDPADVLPRTRFSDGSGNVYKPDGDGADFTRLDKLGFEKKSNEKVGDYGDVERAIAALHAPRSDAARWRSQLEAAFDVDAFLGTLAFSRAIDHFDSYGTFAHNYYLYGDPARGGRLVWISWDHNLTWSAGFSPFGGRTTVMMDEAGKRWPLIRFLLDDAVYRAKFRDALASFVRGPYAKETFDAHATRLHALIVPYVVGEAGERAPFTHLRNAASFQDGLRSLLGAADARRAAIVAALEKEASRAPSTSQ